MTFVEPHDFLYTYRGFSAWSMLPFDAKKFLWLEHPKNWIRFYAELGFFGKRQLASQFLL